MEKKEPIAVFGIPRSGTTWFAQALAANGERIYIHEPDNEKVSALGYLNKKNLDRFPVAEKVEADVRYIELFKKALLHKFLPVNSLGNNLLIKYLNLTPDNVESQIQKSKKGLFSKSSYIIADILNQLLGTKQPRVVKTVHAPLALSVLIKHISFKPLVLMRHPAGVVASMLSLNLPDADRHIYNDSFIKKKFSLAELNKLTNFERMGLQIGIFYNSLSKDINSYNIKYYHFEDLCQDVLTSYMDVYRELGLTWNDSVEQFLSESNKPGRGFKTSRVAEKQPYKWKDQLKREQIQQIKNGYLMLEQDFYTDEW